MNTYNAQNPSEMLHLLMDGELESSMETPLFASLLQNEELRSELRDMLSIRESIRKDVEAFTPPVAATQGIFTRLGYSAPIAPPISTAPLGFMSLLKQKIWHPAVTATLASLITALLFLNFYSTGSNNSQATIAKNNNSVSKIQPTIPVVTNGLQKELPAPTVGGQIAQKQKIVYVDRIVYVDKPEQLTANNNEETNAVAVEEEFTSDDNNNNISLLSSVNPMTFLSFNGISLKPLPKPSHINTVREFSLVNHYYPETTRTSSLMLQVKGLSGTSFPNVDINSLSDKLISNFSLGAYVPITENFHFGLEVGQERFGQSFYNIENNMLFKIEQNPALWWAGFGLKYSTGKHIVFLANAQPFVNITLASTQLGPLGKVSTGLQFVSENGIGIILGLEGSSLVYKNQERLYSTEKLGITYGMFMRF